MPRLGMPIPSGEVARLRRDHYFILGHGAHVERLIRARARRENISSRVEEDLHQAFLKSSMIDAARGGDHLQPHVRMNAPAVEELREQPDILEPSAGAATDFRHAHWNAHHLAD